MKSIFSLYVNGLKGCIMILSALTAGYLVGGFVGVGYIVALGLIVWFCR